MENVFIQPHALFSCSHGIQYHVYIGLNQMLNIVNRELRCRISSMPLNQKGTTNHITQLPVGQIFLYHLVGRNMLVPPKAQWFKSLTRLNRWAEPSQETGLHIPSGTIHLTSLFQYFHLLAWSEQILLDQPSQTKPVRSPQHTEGSSRTCS